MRPAIGCSATPRPRSDYGLAPGVRLAWLVWVVFAGAYASAAAEQPELTRASSLSPSVPAPPSAAPRISGTLHNDVSIKLVRAYPLAVSRLREFSGCRALFEEVGADGLEKLSTALYYQTTEKQERSACSQGSAALTMVGSPQTRLCRVFGQLGADWAATILIHEALHFAGMGERPLDPAGLTSPEINRLVKARCNL